MSHISIFNKKQRLISLLSLQYQINERFSRVQFHETACWKNYQHLILLPSSAMKAYRH